MKIAPPMVWIPMLMLALGNAVAAQEEPLAAEAPIEAFEAEEVVAAAPAAAEDPASSEDVRQRLSVLLNRHPDDLATVLALEPGLLSNEAFLAGYPDLARFLGEHPEIRRNPHFYLAWYQTREPRGVLSEILESLMIFATFLFIALALAWLVRTVVEQKRWNRLSRTQAEVHNKILDRFGSSEELLEYVRSPAGARFLESAPIPLHADQPAARTPHTRVLWSVQIGVVVAAAALGMILVSFRFTDETAEALFALGAIAFCLGAGFVAAAAASISLSRRLGLWRPAPAGEASPEAGSFDAP